MRISFNISAFGPSASQAIEVKERIEALLREYGLDGGAKGMGVEQFASFYGSFTNDIKFTKPEISENDVEE